MARPSAVRAQERERVREFSLSKKDFVPASEGGFVVGEAKTNLTYKDRDTLLIGTDTGATRDCDARRRAPTSRRALLARTLLFDIARTLNSPAPFWLRPRLLASPSLARALTHRPRRAPTPSASPVPTPRPSLCFLAQSEADRIKSSSDAVRLLPRRTVRSNVPVPTRLCAACREVCIPACVPLVTLSTPSRSHTLQHTRKRVRTIARTHPLKNACLRAWPTGWPTGGQLLLSMPLHTSCSWHCHPWATFHHDASRSRCARVSTFLDPSSVPF
eukprot:6188676-Pleurochrysis_carterae.AAC.3